MPRLSKSHGTCLHMCFDSWGTHLLRWLVSSALRFSAILSLEKYLHSFSSRIFEQFAWNGLHTIYEPLSKVPVQEKFVCERMKRPGALLKKIKIKINLCEPISHTVKLCGSNSSLITVATHRYLTGKKVPGSSLASCTCNLAENMTVLMNACEFFKDDMRNALLRMCI